MKAPKKDHRIQKVPHALFRRARDAAFLTVLFCAGSVGFSGSSSPKNPARMSGGNGASKSSAIQNCPLYRPSGRFPSEGKTGTNRATGTPAFEIVISSP